MSSSIYLAFDPPVESRDWLRFCESYQAKKKGGNRFQFGNATKVMFGHIGADGMPTDASRITVSTNWPNDRSEAAWAARRIKDEFGKAGCIVAHDPEFEGYVRYINGRDTVMASIRDNTDYLTSASDVFEYDTVATADSEAWMRADEMGAGAGDSLHWHPTALILGDYIVRVDAIEWVRKLPNGIAHVGVAGVPKILIVKEDQARAVIGYMESLLNTPVTMVNADRLRGQK